MKQLKKIWKWYWGDGSTIHPSIPPYTNQFIVLVLIMLVLYKAFEYIYNLIF